MAVNAGAAMAEGKNVTIKGTMLSPEEAMECFSGRMKAILKEEYDAFAAAGEKELARGLRVNPLKEDPGAFARKAPFSLRPVPWCPSGFYYGTDSARPLQDAAGGESAGVGMRPGKHSWHEAGVYYIQEPSAMAVAELSGAQPGERILDLCAAPGGKSTQLAGMMRGEGLLVSNEIHPERARILSQNIERMGIQNAVVTNETPARLASRMPSFFDRVIVDAPCSGEGMFRKEEQASLMWSEETVAACAARQKEILDCAAILLKPGGTLVYSTCTFAPEEDEGSVLRFLNEHEEFEPYPLWDRFGERFREMGFAGAVQWSFGESDRDTGSLGGCAVRLWPHRLEGEGHFVARLVKKSPAGAGEMKEQQIITQQVLRAKSKKQGKKLQRSSGSAALEQAAALWHEFSAAYLYEDPETKLYDGGGRLVLFGDELYLTCPDITYEGLKTVRPGLHLGTVKKNRSEPSHALALSLKKEEVRAFLDLKTEQEAAAYIRGEVIPFEGEEKGWILVATCGYSLGWGKAAAGTVKNHYPKGLRKQLQ